MNSGYQVKRWSDPFPPNPAMLRFELEKEGYRVFHWNDGPGKAYGTHQHAEAQTHWVISGSIEITVGGISVELSAGDRDYLPADVYHSARVIGDEPVSYLIGELIKRT